MIDRRRQWRAENQDISIEQSFGRGAFRVNGARGKDYVVELRGPSCSCPDWEKVAPEGGCKHILKVKLEEGIIDPLPSASTDHLSPKTDTTSPYPRSWETLSRKTRKRDNWKCQRCRARGGPFGDTELNAHHILPRSKGGGDCLDNLITLCDRCHEREHGHSIPSSPANGVSDTRRSRSDGPGRQSRPDSPVRDTDADRNIPEEHLRERAPEKPKPRAESATSAASGESQARDDEGDHSMDYYLSQDDNDSGSAKDPLSEKDDAQNYSMEDYLRRAEPTRPDDPPRKPRELNNPGPRIDPLAWTYRRSYARHRDPDNAKRARTESLTESDTDLGAPSRRSNESDCQRRAEDEDSKSRDTLRKQAYKRDEHRCQNCGAGGGPCGDAELRAYHIVPLSSGGNRVLSNVATLCSTCHGFAHGHQE